MSIFCKGMVLKDDSMKIVKSGNKITIEGLPIADINHPRLPYDYFNEILRRIDCNNIPSDFLLKIFQLNISIRKMIINESESTNNEVSKMLRQVIDYEIRLISNNN